MAGGVIEYHVGGTPPITMTVGSGGVVGGNLVELSDDWTVIKAADNSKTVIGVALTDGAAGDLVAVAVSGVYGLTAAAAGVVTQGGRIMAGGSGLFKAATDPDGTYSEAEGEIALQIVGIALADIANDGTGPVLLTIG